MSKNRIKQISTVLLISYILLSVLLYEMFFGYWITSVIIKPFIFIYAIAYSGEWIWVIALALLLLILWFIFYTVLLFGVKVFGIVLESPADSKEK